MTHHDEQTAREAFEANERKIGNAVVRDGCLYACERMTHRWLGWQARDAIATTREAELLAVIRAMDGALEQAGGQLWLLAKEPETNPWVLEIKKARRLAEQVV